MRKFFNTILIIAAIIIAIGSLGLFIGSSRSAPDNAIVYLDNQSHTYTAPPCIKSTTTLQVSTIAEARSLEYNPDKKCVDQSGFLQEDRSLTGHLLEALGILKPLPSRWNADGTWNW